MCTRTGGSWAGATRAPEGEDHVKGQACLGCKRNSLLPLTLIRRLIERVRACALQRPLLFCTDGLCSYIRAIRETFRDPVRTGAQADVPGCAPGATSASPRS